LNIHLVPQTTSAPVAQKLLLPTEALLAGFEFGAGQDRPAPCEMPVDVRMSADEPIIGTEARQGFRLGSLNLMIRYEEGSELTNMPLVHRLPNVPHWFAGMANLHGMLLPVFDLARRFGMERSTQTTPLLLVLAHAADAAGIVIDGMPMRLKFDARMSVANADCVPSALSPFIRGLHLLDSELWLDLDSLALLKTLEQDIGVQQ
jgi:chemotaxis signal transduction protein